MDISDAFDDIANYEEQLMAEGEELGMDTGRELGLEEGRALGYVYVALLASELPALTTSVTQTAKGRRDRRGSGLLPGLLSCVEADGGEQERSHQVGLQRI